MARALRGWLPLVLHYSEPWFSDKDIPAGERWSSDVGKKLDETHFGVICLTRENLDSSWILFEAGALSKTLSDSAVCPYLLDVEFSDLTGPLSQFQAKKTDKDSTYELVQDINKKAPNPVDSALLAQLFQALWPKLEQQLKDIPRGQKQVEQPVRREPEILEDLVETVRAVDRRMGSLEENLSRLQSSSTGRSIRQPRQRRVQFDIDMDGTKFDRGRTISMVASAVRPSFVSDAASILGLNPEGFGSDWYLLDAKTSRFLSREDCQDVFGYFGESEALLKVTDHIFADKPF